MLLTSPTSPASRNFQKGSEGDKAVSRTVGIKNIKVGRKLVVLSTKKRISGVVVDHDFLVSVSNRKVDF